MHRSEEAVPMLQLVPAYGKLNSFYETLVQSTKVKPTSIRLIYVVMI